MLSALATLGVTQAPSLAAALSSSAASLGALSAPAASALLWALTLQVQASSRVQNLCLYSMLLAMCLQLRLFESTGPALSPHATCDSGVAKLKSAALSDMR